jgi:hypothetical protein
LPFVVQHHHDAENNERPIIGDFRFGLNAEGSSHLEEFSADLGKGLSTLENLEFQRPDVSRNV